MKFKIRKIYGKGNYRKQCVVLEVLEDCEMGRHQVAKAGLFADGKKATRCKQVYQFLGQKMKKGDFQWLYTCAAGVGEMSIWNSTPKSTTYTFFWALPRRYGIMNGITSLALKQQRGL